MHLSYRQQVTFSGMLIGAMVGAIGALIWLDYRSDHKLQRQAAALGFGDVARIVTATMALVRQVNEMVKDAKESMD